MTLKNHLCCIEIAVDRTYTVNSADNRFYDVILNPDNYQQRDDYKVLSISVDLFTSALCIALIGPFYCAYVSDCTILLDGEILTILQADVITQVKVTDGSIVQHIKLDNLCNFAIYKVEKGYIIYGELEITMLDFNFNKKWSFSGTDIFVSVSGKNPFELRENSIHLWDFEDNEYEIDFEGKSMK